MLRQEEKKYKITKIRVRHKVNECTCNYRTHADDLELSMGGSIKKWTSNGGRVDNIIMVSDEEQEDVHR